MKQPYLTSGMSSSGVMKSLVDFKDQMLPMAGSTSSKVCTTAQCAAGTLRMSHHSNAFSQYASRQSRTLACCSMNPFRKTHGARNRRTAQTRPSWPADENPGRIHFAIAAPCADAVKAYHAAAVANGGTDNGAPGHRAHYKYAARLSLP